MRLPSFALAVIAALAAGGLLLPSTAATAAPAPSASPRTVGIEVAVPMIVTVTSHPLTPVNAPADQYFGRLKLSNLGIRNIIHALSVEGNSPLALPLERTRIMGGHSAIVEWCDEFPRDPWLRHSVLNFADVLVSKHDEDTDMIAVDLLLQASQRFRNTTYAKTVLDRASSIQPSNSIDWAVVPFDTPSLSQVAELHVGRIR